MSTHPGHILHRDFLVPLGIRPSDLARGLAVDRSTVSRLLAGKQPLTPEMAARLGAYFAIPALWWLQMQAQYDAARVELDREAVAGVTPLPSNPDVMLTPRGVLRLDASDDGPSHVASDARVVRYDNGALALVSEEG